MSEDIRLYILMRTDLASMNPGKAVAQGAHAANQCVTEIREDSMDFNDLLDQWEGQTGCGFGTTITLSVDERTMREAIDCAGDHPNLWAGVVHDPTYPLRDGQVVHLIPLDTCGFVFGRKADVEGILDDLPLMP